MVEAAMERPRPQSLASFLKSLGSRPLSRRLSKLAVAGGYLPRITEERITTMGNDLETGRTSHDLPRPVAAGVEVLPESICHLCLNLGNEVWDADYRQKYRLGTYLRRYNSAKDVVRNAEQGCPGCKVVAWALKPYFRWMKEQNGDIVVRIGKGFFNYTGEWASRDMGYYWRPKTTETVCGVIVLRNTPPESGEDVSDSPKGYASPWRHLQSVPRISDHTGSETAVRKVRSWYTECLSSHQLCLQASIPQLPTRVIRIEGPCKARLHTPDVERSEYACLSHRWGGQVMIQTTTMTFGQYAVQLPWDELPKTYQDAIQFAHALGFSYLWIDSLCIIQDSPDDWRHEGSRMSDIYSNAAITLSATWASRPSQGCFVTPDAEYVPRTKAFKNNDEGTHELHCHEWIPRLQVPLHDRGWVFQERMLSKRVVHFMEQELWWECRETITCECRSEYHGRSTFGVDMNQIDRMLELSSPNDIESYWEEIVTIYTTKSLTYPSDIFPGLQGLAKLVPQVMGRYLAGHWEATLVQSLCWHVTKVLTSKLKEWRAPSWSWAAAPERVTWFHPGSDPKTTTFATVLSAMTKSKGDDPMGQISYGSIVLRGRYLVGHITAPGYTAALRLRSPLNITAQFFVCFPYWEQTDLKIGTQIIALNIVQFDGPFFWNSKIGSRKGYWLLLRSVASAEGEYTRVGIYPEPDLTIILDSRDVESVMEEEAVEGEFKII